MTELQKAYEGRLQKAEKNVTSLLLALAYVMGEVKKLDIPTYERARKRVNQILRGKNAPKQKTIR